MSQQQPQLLTSGGTSVQIALLEYGQSLPTTATFAINAPPQTNDTTLSVTPSGDTNKILRAGLAMIAGVGTGDEQWVFVREDTPASSQSIPVEPLLKPIANGATITTFAALPVIGLEAANLNLTTETNQAVLLSNGGWRATDPSTGSFEFSGTLYTPVNAALSYASEMLQNALIDKRNVYVERILPNGTYHAGMCVVSSLSDTTTGAQYVSQSLTLMGSGKIFRRKLVTAA